MIKLFSDMKSNDIALFNECMTMLNEVPGSNEFVCTKSFGELKHVSEFINTNSWNLDVARVQPKFTAFEWAIIEGLMKCTRSDHIENRERMVKSAVQRTTRTVEHWLKNQETLRQISELQSKVKRKAPADAEAQWDKLQTVFN